MNFQHLGNSINDILCKLTVPFFVIEHKCKYTSAKFTHLNFLQFQLHFSIHIQSSPIIDK
uniref:Uncharacterized protein n=1 Tax=Rhizophora mucronata TaxID=61149 RepID=A0A2P2L3P7_RHIMU